jgi:hypothetical protein
MNTSSNATIAPLRVLLAMRLLFARPSQHIKKDPDAPSCLGIFDMPFNRQSDQCINAWAAMASLCPRPVERLEGTDTLEPSPKDVQKRQSCRRTLCCSELVPMDIH